MYQPEIALGDGDKGLVGRNIAKPQYPLESLARGVELPNALQKLAQLVPPVRIVGVELGGSGVGAESFFRIMQEGQRTDMPRGGGGFLQGRLALGLFGGEDGFENIFRVRCLAHCQPRKRLVDAGRSVGRGLLGC